MRKYALIIALLLTAINFAQSQLIVHYQAGASPRELGNSVGIPLIDHSPFFEFALYSVPAGMDVHTVQAQLLNDPKVLWAEDNEITENSENDRNFAIDQGRVGGKIASLYGSEAVNVANPGLYEQLGYQKTPFLAFDRTVKIAVLDTGLSTSHNWLWKRVDSSYNALSVMSQRSSDFPAHLDTNGNGIYDEAVGHGTMVSSLIASFAPYAKLVNIKVSDSDGVSTAWALVKGLTFAAARDCELVNMSLGSLNNILAMSEMLDWADSMGMTVVAAAGNDGMNEARYPARATKVIAVTGVDNDDIKCDFSNWDRKIDFCAPAKDIIGAYWNGGMAQWSGTSFSAPLVTGFLADALRSSSRMTPDELESWIQDRGVNVDSLNPLYARELGVRLSWSALRQ